jgi:DNA-binding transcriptional LysR family regulator
MDRLAAMEAFVLVVDTGSFSAAARRLNVGQPAVSKLVAQLEERLGVKLLVRTTRGLTATEGPQLLRTGAALDSRGGRTGKNSSQWRKET